MYKQRSARVGGWSRFSESQSQSPKGFIRVVCGSQSLERAERRSQSGISGCGHGRWVIPHGRHVSEPGSRVGKDTWISLVTPISGHRAKIKMFLRYLMFAMQGPGTTFTTLDLFPPGTDMRPGWCDPKRTALSASLHTWHWNASPHVSRVTCDRISLPRSPCK